VVSFYESAATPACRQALALLQQQQFIKDFCLAGDTALALQIGHRISADLDWFSAEWKDVRAYCEGGARRLARRFSGLD
jgi:hypothetical protein